MNGKNIALISYIPLVGWIIAFVLYLENNSTDSIARFHLRQTLGLLISYIGGTMILAFFKIGFFMNFRLQSIHVTQNVNNSRYDFSKLGIVANLNM